LNQVVSNLIHSPLSNSRELIESVVAVQYVLETGKWFSKKVRVLKLFDDKIHVLNSKD